MFVLTPLSIVQLKSERPGVMSFRYIAAARPVVPGWFCLFTFPS